MTIITAHRQDASLQGLLCESVTQNMKKPVPVVTQDMKKPVPVVTPVDEGKKTASKTAKSPAKKGTKGAFGRKALIEDFGDDATVTKKLPVEIRPEVDSVYR